LSGAPPECARLETHRVNVLRLLALEQGIRVRKNEYAVIKMDGAEFSARVSRQPCMACRIDDPGAHRLSGLKMRRHRNIPAGGRAPVTRGGYLLGGERRRGFARLRRWLPALDFPVRDKPSPLKQLYQTCIPFFVVAHAQVFRGRN